MSWALSRSHCWAVWQPLVPWDPTYQMQVPGKVVSDAKSPGTADDGAGLAILKQRRDWRCDSPACSHGRDPEVFRAHPLYQCKWPCRWWIRFAISSSYVNQGEPAVTQPASSSTERWKSRLLRSVPSPQVSHSLLYLELTARGWVPEHTRPLLVQRVHGNVSRTQFSSFCNDSSRNYKMKTHSTVACYQTSFKQLKW